MLAAHTFRMMITHNYSLQGGIDMQETISVLLVIAVLLTFCSLTASAKCSISDELNTQINTVKEDETIRVNIWVNSKTMDENEMHRQAMADAGFEIWEFDKLNSEQMSKYVLARRNIETALEEESCQSFIDSFGLKKESINYTIATCINANLTKGQIIEASAHSKVNTIYYDSQEELPIVDPTEQTPSISSVAEESFKRLLQEEYGSCYEDYHYQEVYYHYDMNSEIDWVLFEGTIRGLGDLYGNVFVGNRLITQRNSYKPFFGTMGIYSVKYDNIFDATLVNPDYFDGFEEVYNTIGYGALMGDIDHDNDISIIDATIIQRCEANISNYPETDRIDVLDESALNGVKYYSDFNRDGERDILDATCIQRYLVGIPTPFDIGELI